MNEERIATKFDGWIGEITAQDHPHYGAIVRCLGADRIPQIGFGFGMAFVDIETEIEFYVFDGKDVKWLKKT